MKEGSLFVTLKSPKPQHCCRELGTVGNHLTLSRGAPSWFHNVTMMKLLNVELFFH
jgi:hypothetical protein